ncbi:hypothetical protein ALQ79_200305 [Pseudomonas amygdali pv. lachrymans]|nr:hypothetical protein ALQ79_200305 [Pseudomonas amygdali pv. lachrymans]
MGDLGMCQKLVSAVDHEAIYKAALFKAADRSRIGVGWRTPISTNAGNQIPAKSESSCAH